MRSFRFPRVFVLLAVIALLAIALGATPRPAKAYGSDALWQIGLSANCNNPSLCLNPPFGIGGFWGWIEFDQNGMGDATLTGCSHLSSSLGALTGADHLNIEITDWTIASHLFGPPTFVITDGTVTFSGVNTKGAPVTVPLLALFGGPFDTGVPAAAGHYSYQSLFGFTPPPGVNFQYQVVQITH